MSKSVFISFENILLKVTSEGPHILPIVHNYRKPSSVSKEEREGSMQGQQAHLELLWRDGAVVRGVKNTLS